MRLAPHTSRPVPSVSLSGSGMVLCLLACLLLATAAWAQSTEPAPAPEAATASDSAQAPQSSAKPAPPATLQAPVRTQHSLTLADGSTLAYTAEAGNLEIGGPDAPGDLPPGRIFYVAYFLNDAGKGDAGKQTTDQPRPLTFAFNGGPGAGSLWLQLGAMGPRRVVLDPDGSAPAPPPVLADNQETWLPFTDMVFVDPVGTGFSRSLPDQEAAGGKGEGAGGGHPAAMSGPGGHGDAGKGNDRAFWGVDPDIQAMGDFVRRFLSQNKRWLSPLYLTGESYGTFRAAGLSAKLFNDFGLALSGIVLISPVLDYATIWQSDNDLAYALLLPSYAVAAGVHGRLAPELAALTPAELMEMAEQFGQTEYLVGLAAGDRLDPAAAQELLRHLAAFTGLDPAFLADQQVRVPTVRFQKQLLADKSLVIGRMDTSLSGPPLDPTSPYAAYDPSLEPLYGPFATACNAYLRDELGFDTPLNYEFLSDTVNRAWDYSSGLRGGQGFVDSSRALREAMVLNRAMRVLVVNGIYDLATPWAAVRYSLAHLFLPPELAGNVHQVLLEGGHMAFTHPGARAELARRAAIFYAGK